MSKLKSIEYKYKLCGRLEAKLERDTNNKIVDVYLYRTSLLRSSILLTRKESALLRDLLVEQLGGYKAVPR